MTSRSIIILYTCTLYIYVVLVAVLECIRRLFKLWIIFLYAIIVENLSYILYGITLHEYIASNEYNCKNNCVTFAFLSRF